MDTNISKSSNFAWPDSGHFVRCAGASRIAHRASHPPDGDGSRLDASAASVESSDGEGQAAQVHIGLHRGQLALAEVDVPAEGLGRELGGAHVPKPQKRRTPRTPRTPRTHRTHAMGVKSKFCKAKARKRVAEAKATVSNAILLASSEIENGAKELVFGGQLREQERHSKAGEEKLPVLHTGLGGGIVSSCLCTWFWGLVGDAGARVLHVGQVAVVSLLPFELCLNTASVLPVFKFADSGFKRFSRFCEANMSKDLELDSLVAYWLHGLG